MPPKNSRKGSVRGTGSGFKSESKHSYEAEVATVAGEGSSAESGEEFSEELSLQGLQVEVTGIKQDIKLIREELRDMKDMVGQLTQMMQASASRNLDDEGALQELSLIHI